MKSQLTVYKASAGSGKTFTLAREYMTLVIDNPYAYRTILAVTFTNKATEEMKLRILGQLYGIAHHLPESDQYLNQIHEALPHLSESQIRKNAEAALRLLIHNYNYFHVQTIDTFFQSVLRNLARELDLTANLRIGLNDYQVEQQAVDELIESLEDTDKLLFWIMEYIKENIADDKGWNVIGQIKSFGEHIFRDYYKENADKLSERMAEDGFFEGFKEKMKNIKKKAKEQFDEIAASFFDALEEGGYSADDLSGKTRGIWSYFNKIKNGKYSDDDLLNLTFTKCMESPDNWVKKADVKNHTDLYQQVSSVLYPILQFSEQHRPTLVKMYKSADLTVKHLNQLRLLGSIDKKVRTMNQEANRFLLSDTQTLLHSLIQDSDSPFIFEKIGTQLNHVMIDEFQDTSTIQWKNFKVLLEETMSREDAGNLIVGDVKQSIYRWRSGDWRLLNNIESEFINPKKQLDIETLDTNYRSDRNVIDFNNAFFVEAAKQEYENLKEAMPEEAQQLLNAYADVEQKVPANKRAQGYVEIKLLKTQEDEDTADESTGKGKGERMMQLCLETVDKLVARGVPTNKIAILVRNNQTIQDIAEYFMNHSDYEMVSDEAFRLDASQAVQTLVTALHYLMHPNDDIARATLLKYALTYLDSEELVNLLTSNRQEYLEIPLLDLTERLFTEFRLGEVEDMKAQSAYVCAFYDKLNAFLADNSSDIEAFLQEWDANLHGKSIHCDGTDGIRLLTIHKSKGLEYDHVIMPYCDWQLEKSNTIWCTPQEEPYNELPLVPVDFSAGQMKQSIYEPDYHHEHLQNMVDNLNLLYVAFTRAGHNLYVFGKRATQNYRSSIIELSLDQVAEKLKKAQESISPLAEDKEVPVEIHGLGTDSKTSDIVFTYGEPYIPKKKVVMEMKLNSNVFTLPSEMMETEIIVSSKMPEFKQSNKSRDLIVGDEEEEQQKYYIKMGTVLHSLFSTIRTHDDIDGALKQLELDGVLYDENISKEKVREMIRKRLESDKVNDWFSDRWEIFNECSIISMNKGKMEVHRPDRVMKDENETIVVDFKFGKPRQEYHDQVKGYMDLLSGMGHPNVKGYLWYVYPNKIVEVK
ncbi:UvrD-helicase domain-containing protein [Segatella copri]|uniref:UvrD-helicase domain-containing protein n=1 Tax=Segatella copri TaxID=165179 RepID=UPI001C491C3A|nr:UvrD-helicase domain-containing protein [Segatella copri]WOZ83576.1 UvrD-helicase domain-containing protein [Segatella copri]